jgi:hypothetical protein
MTWNTARRFTHRLTVLLGDAQALSRGRVAPRLLNRAAGRGVSGLLRGKWL